MNSLRVSRNLVTHDPLTPLRGVGPGVRGRIAIFVIKGPVAPSGPFRGWPERPEWSRMAQTLARSFGSRGTVKLKEVCRSCPPKLVYYDLPAQEHGWNRCLGISITRNSSRAEFR
jgi:hypothetical protein